ncbi:MAG TPA: methylthioribulose 1-phosphate dehydratase [Pyrinomonadaceae bacterium]|nr:methylthioribulose 1-phosphate dehydratase [Acidobacteriota bacterium]HQZ96215.1 methylthioribulose 1-phosphate dehydratase [Pyrinomonadaceae bacterium]HRA41630.1 methylthioribulose 1-phosphate dehydratase [Pyrinomonadaceae bacterium]
MSENPPQSPTTELAETGREFYRRGWARGASGNFSILLARKPLRLCITAAGNEKGALDETNFLEIDDDAEILQGFGRPSDETVLHLSIYRLRPKARCILYSQTVWGMLLADKYFVDGSIVMQGYEALKGLSGRTTHDEIERIPIVENAQDQIALSHVIENVLLENPTIHGIYIRRHGLYTWGETVEDARKNVDIFEFMFEVLGRGTR